MFVTELCNVS